MELPRNTRILILELLVIGKSAWGPLPGVPSRSVEWSEESEAELISRSHAGIMPLPDDTFARGKSAYKLIQYAGAGLPAMGSPVGENCKVIQEGVTGFLCATPEEWIEKVKLLAADPQRRKSMGEAARKRSELWSLEANAQKLTAFLTGNPQVQK